MSAQQQRAPEIVARYTNHYHCEDCDESWSDEWCCTCDDDCPTCGDAISPESSDEEETFELEPGEECHVCGSEH